jgi:hypothetical protein
MLAGLTWFEHACYSANAHFIPLSQCKQTNEEKLSGRVLALMTTQDPGAYQAIQDSSTLDTQDLVCRSNLALTVLKHQYTPT